MECQLNTAPMVGRSTMRAVVSLYILLLLSSAPSFATSCKIDLANLERIRSLRVAVVGDVMLDELTYVVDRNRLSPESQVAQDYLWHSEEIFPGGAANVALNAKRLGAEVFLMAPIGRDEAGYKLVDLLERLRITTRFDRNGLIFADDRVTTVKARCLRIDNAAHVHRISRETQTPIGLELETEILERIKFRKPHVIILSDYAKGVVTPSLSQQIIQWAAKNNSIVVVDPKGQNYQKYRGATLVKPNRSELEDLSQRSITDTDVPALLQKLKDDFGIEIAMATLSHSGMIALNAQGNILRQPTLAANVVDVTGAGDSTTAAIALSLAAQFSLQDSLIIACLLYTSDAADE